MGDVAVLPSTVPTEPGVYRDLSFENYHAIKAMSHSVLEGFVPPRTPAHGRELMLHPREQTADLAIGYGGHVCILEPERFELEYVVAPKFDRRTTAGKAGWAEFEAANRGKALLAADEHARLLAMRAAVLAHPTARELLQSPGANELSLIWPDESTGLLCKGRLDHVGPLGGDMWVVDLKTARSAAERAFQRDAGAYGYFRQLSFYRDGLNALRPHPRRCALVVVEKEPPYCVACYELDERALEQGARENRTALDKFAECQESGVFHGFDAGLGLIDYPAYLTDKLD